MENTLGGRFWRLRVQTLPGSIDVVTAADALAAEVPVDGIALVDAWLVGRPLVPVPKAGWLRRILAP